jgi:hypothetical protein
MDAQLRYAAMLRTGDEISEQAEKSAHYSKLAADQGSVEGQLMYARYLFHRARSSTDMKEAEKYLELASRQGDSAAQMQYGIVLLSGLLGRFDFIGARHQFDAAARSNRFALILRDALSGSDDELVTPQSFEKTGNVFSLMRSESDEGIPIIRVMNPHLCRTGHDTGRVFSLSKDMAQSSIAYLLDLSRIESTVLRSLPIDLISCQSFSEIIKLIFKMYSSQSSLYKNVNHFLRCFPIRFLGKFMKELREVLGYIYLLQSSIGYDLLLRPLTEDCIVYRGFSSGGSILAPLYMSVVGEVIILPGFTSTSTDFECAVHRFVQKGGEGEDGILFEIELHAGDIAANIACYSAHSLESEVLIAASSAFRVVGVDYIQIQNKVSKELSNFEIPKVKLSYFMHWYDLDIDQPPPSFMV